MLDAAHKATTSGIPVSGPVSFQGSCGWAVNQHHSHASLSGSLETLSFVIKIFLRYFVHAALIQTIEDADNLKFTKSMRVGDKKHKYDL